MHETDKAACVTLLADVAKSVGLAGRRTGSDEWNDLVVKLVAAMESAGWTITAPT
jgi:hypothetical protein